MGKVEEDVTICERYSKYARILGADNIMKLITWVDALYAAH